MARFITPFLHIGPTNVSNVAILQQSSSLIGEIKYMINYDYLYELANSNTIGTIGDNNNVKVYKNEEFVKYVDESNYNFIPMPDYYNDDVNANFDMYGTSYNINFKGTEFSVKVYFYQLKNPELLTKALIQKLRLIFMYDFFMNNNTLNMDWHGFRMSQYFKNLETQYFRNLNYEAPANCKTKLFHHQQNNISRMLEIYRTPLEIEITDNLIQKYENGLIYDFVKTDFIEEADIPKMKLQSGMILDEPGTGKTLQFILFLMECKKKSLVLVPNENIKAGWLSEFNKHFGIDATTLATEYQNIHIMTFDDAIAITETDKNFLDRFEILGIDEIHILYSSNKQVKTTTKIDDLFEKIVECKIPTRWGLTGTPFINELSMFNIIRYVFGHNFLNERIANIPSLQDDLLKVMLKNTKSSMKPEDYVWPELIIEDKFVELDVVQRNFYDVESKTTFNKTNLRKLVSEVQLMFDKSDIKTPTQLKHYGVNHYKQLFLDEQTRLENFKNQLENIKQNKEKFDELEYLNRVEQYKQMIIRQEEVVRRHKAGYEYFMESIEAIAKVFEGKASDEGHCPICFDDYSPPIKYFKLCGHYFCESCIDGLYSQDIQVGSLVVRNAIKCPMCRRDTPKADIISVNEVAEINDSPKIYEILNIIRETNDKFIIFSQFNILDKLLQTLNKREFTAQLYTDYMRANRDDPRVLLLSSESNAEGIDLSMYDRLIIFEPFEDHMYCREIEKQLIGRIHRVGRTKPVNVYRLITKDTIEEEIYNQVAM